MVDFLVIGPESEFDVVGIMKEDCIIEGDHKFTRILIKRKIS